VEDILLIEREIGFAVLPPKLSATAELRLENRESSLAELSELSLQGRSALNHRLRRLGKIAENIRLYGAENWDQSD
jgi:DNA-binding protein WhiA